MPALLRVVRVNYIYVCIGHLENNTCRILFKIQLQVLDTDGLHINVCLSQL